MVSPGRSSIHRKVVTASDSLPRNQLPSPWLPLLSSLPAKALAQNLSSNFAASVLGRSPAGSTLQARSVPAVHAGVKPVCLDGVSRARAQAERSYHADLCQGLSLGNSQSVHTAVSVNPRVAASASPEELSR